jgi:hypothetical protein
VSPLGEVAVVWLFWKIVSRAWDQIEASCARRSATRGRFLSVLSERLEAKKVEERANLRSYR